jgi:hypothetical protein
LRLLAARGQNPLFPLLDGVGSVEDQLLINLGLGVAVATLKVVFVSL